MSIYGHQDALNSEPNGTGMESDSSALIFAASLLIAVCLTYPLRVFLGSPLEPGTETPGF